MSRTLNISIENKIATGNDVVIVCDNSDYSVKFTFDSEWDKFTTKTMRVKYGSGGYAEVLFVGDTCSLPPISNSNSVSIGVYAGDIETSTPARFTCQKSILSGDGVHTPPPEDVYNQLIDLLENQIGNLNTALDGIIAKQERYIGGGGI